jgi:hypothetical protein
MDLLDVFAAALAVLLVVLVVSYLRMGRGLPWTQYRGGPAWIRAGIYFTICYLLSYASGGLELILTSPVVTQEQLQNPVWIAYTLFAFAFICVAYGYVWVKYTVVFDRPKNTAISALFGFLWGSSSGQLFLAVWLWSQDISAALDFPIQVAWIGAWALLGAWQPNWHGIYWDHYIAPEHDTPLTQRIKALGCHIPNLVITLTYLALYDNYLIFVGLQILACTFPSIGMRFPAPWAVLPDINLAHRTPYRVPRCTGYISDDYLTDPYTPFYRGWTGPKQEPSVESRV